MGVFLHISGSERHSVRIGFSGQRPLIYAVYVHNTEEDLPYIHGQSYRDITRDQYEWLLNHLACDVVYVPAQRGLANSLECRSHDLCYKLFSNEPIKLPELWDERQV
jgi:hypothetical protein